MKRYFTLVVGFSALVCASGCCCWGSRCSDWDGCGAYNAGCGDCDAACGDCKKSDRRGRSKRRCESCCEQEGCDPCCGQEAGAAPITPAYDPAMNLGGTGCQGCASGSFTSGLPVTSAMPFSSGCSTGNCGVSTYNGMPIDGSTGWTIQPTPLSEPMPAPPASGTGGNSAPSSSTSSVPVPTPFPTPVSSTK